MPNEDSTKIIIDALEDDKYEWRTISGLAKSTGISEEEVLSEIQKNRDLIVRSSLCSKSGEALFTTRRHYRKKGDVVGKILGAFKGRVR